MKNSLTISLSIFTILATLSPLAASALGVDAGVRLEAGAKVGSSTVGAAAQANADVRMTKGKDRAHEEIQRRVTALQELTTHVSAMVRVSDEVKTSVGATLATQIAALTALDAKIAADTDIDTLKADIKSITGGYRIFALVMPRGRIAAASDRIKSITASLTTLSGKLTTRIAAAQTEGKNVSALASLSADMATKTADANVQADAAVTLIAGLMPDNGDKAKMSANQQALKDARAKIKAAQTDVQAARKDAGQIVDGLKTLVVGVSASTTVVSH